MRFMQRLRWPDYLFRIVVHRHGDAVDEANRIVAIQRGVDAYYGAYGKLKRVTSDADV